MEGSSTPVSIYSLQGIIGLSAKAAAPSGNSYNGSRRSQILPSDLFIHSFIFPQIK